MTHFFRIFEQLKEEGKIKSDDIDNEFPKYIKLNKTKLSDMMIKKLKDKDDQRTRNRTNKRNNKTELKKLEIKKIMNQKSYMQN